MRLEFDPKQNVHNAFPTPIGVFEVPNAAEINPVLERVILEREQAGEGIVASNRGGWQSKADMLEWGVPEVQDLAESVWWAAAHLMGHVAKAQRFNVKQSIQMWANVNRAGQYNQFHNHADCHFSGAYYVKMGDFAGEKVKGSGNIEFFDPRGAVNVMNYGPKSDFGAHIAFTPKEGQLLLFPGFLYHGVNAFQSEQTRISIAFNAKMFDFQEI